MRRIPATIIALSTLFLPARSAFAGGFEVPDNGTEALGRGGAFVAKADDGTAIEYNIAGFARQRGTRLTIDANLIFHDTAFTRSGFYPGDPSDSRTPYAGQPYPTVHDQSNLFPAPMGVVSTDLGGLLKRWTLAFGVYGPSAIGTHNYGVGNPAPGQTDDPPATVTLPNGMTAPNPARYDISKTNLLIAFPTLAVGFHAWKWLDVGFAWQIYYANFDLANANITPVGKTLCPTPDYAGCDSYGHVTATGNSFSSSSGTFNVPGGHAYSPGLGSFGWVFSLLAHPTDWLDIGWTLRPQINVNAEGNIHPIPAPALTSKIPDSPVVFSSILPLYTRLGGRVVKRYPDGTERADLEVDLTYENWSAEVADHLHAENFALGINSQLDADIVHNYRDTFGVRVGGAYNHRLNDWTRLIGRAGFYFDSSAATSSTTRLDFDTLAKWGFTLGAGIKWKAFMINIAYAFVYSRPRTVGDSTITAISAFNGTNYQKTDPIIPVSNGLYEPMIQILSLGVTVNFSELKLRTLMPN